MPIVITASKAEYERKRELDRRRGTAKQRGYDSQWRKVRALKLAREPRCEMHLERGKLVPATVVDHILSIEERPDLRLEMSNLRSLCKACHDARTAADQGFNRHKRVIDRSCDVNGWPTDPQHWWNR